MGDNSPTGPSQDIIGERITFVVPSSSDFERITGFKNFTALWSVSANTIANGAKSVVVGGGNSGGGGQSKGDLHTSSHSGLSSANRGASNFGDSDANVLDSLFGKLSKGSVEDFHQILNYLWIGAVVALVVLSLIFIVFSFYFYRKFVEWKKCNKDIQSQIPNDLQQPYQGEDVYLKIESPPCYTIATGLPTYSEALRLYAQQYDHQLNYLWPPSLWNHRAPSREFQPLPQCDIKSTCESTSQQRPDGGSYPNCNRLSVVEGCSGVSSRDSDNNCRTVDTISGAREVSSSSQSLEGDNQLTDVVVLS